MRNLTPEEKEKLQAMIEEQNRDHGKKQRVYLKRKAAERTARRMAGSGFQTPTSMPTPESTAHRTKHHLVSRNQTEIRRMQLTEKEKEEFILCLPGCILHLLGRYIIATTNNPSNGGFLLDHYQRNWV